MNNLFMIIGKVKEISEFIDNDFLEVKVEVARNFKNDNGVYETDTITCKIYKLLFTTLNKYCNVGDLIGVKGRIQTNNGNLELIAEKVTFLASKRKVEE